MATNNTTANTTATVPAQAVAAVKGARLAWGQPGQPGVTVQPNGKAHTARGYNGAAYAVTYNANNGTYNLAHRAAKGGKVTALVTAGTYAACYTKAVAHNKDAATKGAQAAAAAASRKASKAAAPAPAAPAAQAS